MIVLLDTLLRQVNVKFPFTVYKCLAASKDDGMIEFVKNSLTIQEIQFKYESDLMKFLEARSKSEFELKQITETYLLSSAGYAAVTYLLAIGDRHLENLMVQDSGHLFHIDFGYILGKNPPNKDRWVPPIRINEPMVKGMGGIDSKGYAEFKQKTIDAIIHLRNYR